MKHGLNTEAIRVSSMFNPWLSSLFFICLVTTHYPLTTNRFWAALVFRQHTTVYKCCQQMYRNRLRFWS